VSFSFLYFRSSSCLLSSPSFLSHSSLLPPLLLSPLHYCPSCLLYFPYLLSRTVTILLRKVARVNRSPGELHELGILNQI
jgi:hypothetical protein